MKSIRGKILVCFMAVIAVSVLIPLLYFRIELRRDLEANAASDALRQAEIMARTLYYRDVSLAGSAALLEDLAPLMRGYETRLTVLDPEGAVVFDSDLGGAADLELDNHLNRREVREALAGGQGVSVRRSNTTGLEYVYAAVRLEDGGLLRLAVPYAGLDGLLYDRLAGFLLACLVAVALSMLLAALFARKLRGGMQEMVAVVDSMARGDYARRLRRVPGAEFAALAGAVNSMAENIERQLQRVADRNGQLEAILHTVPSGVLVLDAAGRIRSHNPALEDLFPEFASGDGRPLAEVLPNYELASALGELMSDESAGPGAQRSLDLELPPGRALLVRLARPAADLPENGRYSLGAVLVFSDISRLVRLERTRRDFVANVSHELRTPLTAIQGYAETLSSLIGAPESLAQQRRFAGVIERQAARLGRLVEDLLGLARLESGRLESGRLEAGAAACRPARVAAEVNQLFARSAEQAGVRVELDLPEDLELAISGDHLFQVLENLLDNALRFAPPESRVEIRAVREGDCGRVSVSDQGPGIGPDERERVFERFYKAGGQVGPSSGLGLAICKHIVEFYGGAMSVASPAGDFATTFSFTIKVIEGS